jgi:hypothetical protein
MAAQDLASGAIEAERGRQVVCLLPRCIIRAWPQICRWIVLPAHTM